MICVSIELQAKSDMVSAVEDLFREYIPIAEKLPGCVRFELHRSRSASERFLLYELYETYEDLLSHRHDSLFAEWRPRIAALEVSRTLTEWDTLVAQPKAGKGQ